jgi:drug/metabolite transporter (DMT)-like permease
MVWTMTGVFAGMGLILRGSHGNVAAHWTGDLLALCVALLFAASLTAVRQVRGQSMLPAVPVALLGAAFVLFWVGNPSSLWDSRAPLWLAHGGFIAMASALMTLGPRYITAPEVALLILLESILSPLLVWAVLAEHPGSWTLAGGAVVIVVLVLSNLIALRRARLRAGAA